jgi:hypothetical protein
MDEAKPVGCFNSYAGFIEIIRQQIAALDTSLEQINEAAGLPSRYLSKLVCAHAPKRFGSLSFDLVAATLGLRFVVYVDE